MVSLRVAGLSPHPCVPRRERSPPAGMTCARHGPVTAARQPGSCGQDDVPPAWTAQARPERARTGPLPARDRAPAAASRSNPGRRGAGPMRRQVYELRVRGPVPPELLEEIGAVDLGGDPPLTILRTEPTDQPGLHGMLQRLRSLGLDLLEVRTTLKVEPFDRGPA